MHARRLSGHQTRDPSGRGARTGDECWWLGTESNCRPGGYESPALPLSYPATGADCRPVYPPPAHSLRLPIPVGPRNGDNGRAQSSCTGRRGWRATCPARRPVRSSLSPRHNDPHRPHPQGLRCRDGRHRPRPTPARADRSPAGVLRPPPPSNHPSPGPSPPPSLRPSRAGVPRLRSRNSSRPSRRRQRGTRRPSRRSRSPAGRPRLLPRGPPHSPAGVRPDSRSPATSTVLRRLRRPGATGASRRASSLARSSWSWRSSS